MTRCIYLFTCICTGVYSTSILSSADVTPSTKPSLSANDLSVATFLSSNDPPINASLSTTESPTGITRPVFLGRREPQVEQKDVSVVADTLCWEFGESELALVV